LEKAFAAASGSTTRMAIQAIRGLVEWNGAH
jgi:hypothetical protein